MSEDLGILVLDQENIGYDLNYSALARFGPLSLRPNIGPDSLAEVVAQTRARVLVCNRPPFSADTLDQIARLGVRLICLTATGTNTVDLGAAALQGIAVCNIKGYATNSVAQHTFALALELINQTKRQDAAARTWHAQPGRKPGPWTNLELSFNELAGKTWGIIGMGAIGRAVAVIAQAFGCAVVWASAGESQRAEAWPRLPIDDLLQASDIVSVHSPITDSSRDLLDQRRISLMKGGAYLINVGRGGIVNEAALALALRQKTIAGAGIDVLWPEPPLADNPLLALPPDCRLIITPHVAWAAIEARQRAIDECALNIAAWLRGEARNRVA